VKGSVTAVNLRLCAAGTTVATGALVTRLKSAKLFLGFDWLQAVNPKIDWATLKIGTEDGTVPMQMRNVSKVPDYKARFPRVFSEVAFQDLPLRRKWDHQINLVPGHSPLRGQCYPLAAREREALESFVEINLKSGRIQGSDSPYASPFFFRPKLGSRELRGIQDYRCLNEITIKDRYPLPLIQDVLAKAQESKVFKKMDLRWGFNNIHIREGDEYKATFIIPKGLYQPNIMQFGLCNAPSTFQRMVDEVLAEEKNSGHIEVYIDDILVHTKDEDSNWYWTGRVLAKLEEYSLFC
jgi:hypothetical protein